jgi:hypothetical protein
VHACCCYAPSHDGVWLTASDAGSDAWQLHLVILLLWIELSILRVSSRVPSHVFFSEAAAGGVFSGLRGSPRLQQSKLSLIEALTHNTSMIEYHHLLAAAQRSPFATLSNPPSSSKSLLLSPGFLGWVALALCTDLPFIKTKSVVKRASHLHMALLRVTGAHEPEPTTTAHAA